MYSYTLSLYFPTECKHLLRSGMLNTDSQRRYDITELRLSLWMRGPAVPLTPYSTTRITREDCLPHPLPLSLPHWEARNIHLPSSPATDPLTATPGHRNSSSSPSASSSVNNKKRGKEGNSKDISLKTKISSASRKLVHTFTHHRPSSS